MKKHMIISLILLILISGCGGSKVCGLFNDELKKKAFVCAQKYNCIDSFEEV